jgi:Concanavalin A-like lectin/glucanases superfamily/Domain of unknown function (DUF2341)
MKTKKEYHFFKLQYVLALLTGMVLHCVNTSDLAGAGSETTTTVSGVVASVNGAPAAYAIVSLIPSTYNPVKEQGLPDSFTITANAFGQYSFSKIDTGSYTVYAQSKSDGTRSLVFNVHITNDSVTAPPSLLKKTGAILAVNPDDEDNDGCYIYIPGTTIYAFFTKDNRDALLDSIPSGVIPSVVYATLNSSAEIPVRQNITVYTSDTTVAANPQWGYMQRLFLSTAADGASITSTVRNFPVLVRLDKSNFDFNTSNSDGSDIRFTTQQNTFLPYEIELWNPSLQKAAIWVTVDSICGNNNRQFIAMYWGNRNALTVSNSTLTFDTSDGFQGVWHLGGDIVQTAFDATKNGYHGTAANMTSSDLVSGIIGDARSFDGVKSYITMPNTSKSKLDFQEDGTYTMSAWVYADAIDSVYHAVAGKGHEQYYMQFKCFRTKASWEFVEFEQQRGWEYSEDSTPPAPGANEWIYLTGVRSGTNQKLYINGVLTVDSPKLMSGASYERNTTDNFSIGSFGRPVTIPYQQGWSFFYGQIDEVRVQNTVVSDDWIKLCYMNQKADDALVKYRK